MRNAAEEAMQNGLDLQGNLDQGGEPGSLARRLDMRVTNY
jgi:hypothetical protein